MDSFEESQFYDAMDQISPETDLSHSHCIKNWEYDLWVSRPRSVKERRMNFIRRMGLSPDELEGHISLRTRRNSKDCAVKGDLGRIMEDSVDVHRNSCIEEECSSSSSSMSSSSTTDDVGLCECGSEDESCNCECEEGLMNFSPCSCKAYDCVHEEDVNGSSPAVNKSKWLSKLRKMTCVFNRNVKDDVEVDSLGRVQGTRMRRIKVSHSRKSLRELSGLFTGQDIHAHEASISVMKFSPDGRYLASAGEDKIVKVWHVVEDERLDTIDIPDADPSCVYFSVNHLSELGHITVEKDRINKFRTLRKTPDSACVILPHKVFRILETPLHVFEGHSGEILDLSWSKNNHLLSSSTDKTVRLWRVGIDQCLKVFSHTDYVTCIQFSPVNDDYFISGSIDGKVRVWEISGCHVVEWTETKDIITALSYRPDGLGGIIGFITGNCRFFNMSDGRIQLETQLCLTSKKKRPCKKITGFQFSPQDPSKVLVTCAADSHVRIIDGTDVIAKYKGFRNAGNHMSASFTWDEKHIISSSDDSNIYVWNYINQERCSLSQQPKSIRSFECFRSDASVTTTWPGFRAGNTDNTLNSLDHFSPMAYFSSSHLDSGSKGSATWPEEKLPISSSSPEMGKSHYKLFKNSCRSMSDSHAWGLVILTGGWDGRIKSFHSYGLPMPL